MAKSTNLEAISEWLIEYCGELGLSSSETKSLMTTLRKLDNEELNEAITRTVGRQQGVDEDVIVFLESSIASLQAFQLVNLDRNLRLHNFIFSN